MFIIFEGVEDFFKIGKANLITFEIPNKLVLYIDFQSFSSKLKNFFDILIPAELTKTSIFFNLLKADLICLALFTSKIKYSLFSSLDNEESFLIFSCHVELR